jgi:ADP-heptose:LPS heptosyltransferase
MDAIVTIDSVLVHVAGVLGKPTWLVLPRAADWRWGLHPNENRWYPSVRLVREEAGKGREEVFWDVGSVLHLFHKMKQAHDTN